MQTRSQAFSAIIFAVLVLAFTAISIAADDPHLEQSKCKAFASALGPAGSK